MRRLPCSDSLCPQGAGCLLRGPAEGPRGAGVGGAGPRGSHGQWRVVQWRACPCPQLCPQSAGPSFRMCASLVGERWRCGVFRYHKQNWPLHTCKHRLCVFCRVLSVLLLVQPLRGAFLSPRFVRALRVRSISPFPRIDVANVFFLYVIGRWTWCDTLPTAILKRKIWNASVNVVNVACT